MRRLVYALALIPALSYGQVPNLTRLARGTVLSDPLPPAPVGQPVDYWAGVYLDQSLSCTRFTINGATWQPCTATTSDVTSAVASEASARNAAISAATSGLATTAALNTAISNEVTARNTAISSATTGLASTADLNTAISNEVVARNSAISTATTGLASTASVNAAIAAESTARTTAINTAVAPLATSASVTSEASTRAAADIALGVRIDNIIASPDTVCGTTTVTGLSIPLTGISTATTLTVAGAVAGAPCVVGGSSFLPLGAYGVCAVTATNTIQIRFQGGGLLSAIISIPNGTYKACALVRP